jgi:hypothetical protein
MYCLGKYSFWVNNSNIILGGIFGLERLERIRVYVLLLHRTVLFESIGTFGAFYVSSARNTGNSSRNEFRLQSG